MPAAFHIGQRVKCIYDHFNNSRDAARPTHPKAYGFKCPQKGRVYTIRGFNEAWNGLGLYLEELVNQPDQFADKFAEQSFDSAAFRPLKPDEEAKPAASAKIPETVE